MKHSPNHEWLKDHIRDIPDFPKPGVVFKDIDGLVVEAEYSAVWNPANTLPLLPHVLSLLGGKR